MSATEEKITYTSTPEQVARMHVAFDKAIELARQELGQSHPIIIDGIPRSSDKEFSVHSPIDRELLIGTFQSGTFQDVDDAVAAAQAAYPAWSCRPWQDRVAIARQIAADLRADKFRIAALLIFEAGKNRGEAIGEVEEAADILTEYAQQVEDADGFTRHLGTIDPREQNVSILRPFGVWAVLAPFNFPHALSIGMSIGAIIAGNTVVYKPASSTPLAGYEIACLYEKAGLPAGVFNYITGGGEAVGEPLAHHKDVDAVVFTGSKEVGFDLYKTVPTEFPKPVITEMGGKNPAIVTRNADVDKAVEGVARSAFGFSGQKCSACSRVYVEKPVYDEFIEKLTARAEAFKVTDPTERDAAMGPVIDDKAVKRFEQAVDAAEGGTIRAGGKRLTGGIYDNGTFVAPTVVDGLPLDHDLFKRELFLPFVVVGQVDSLDQALAEANDTEYGLTAGIFSEDGAEIDQFFNTIEAGVVYANRSGGATTGAWPGCQSFCGWKGSGSSGKGGLGPYYVQQFLREQSRTVVVDE